MNEDTVQIEREETYAGNAQAAEKDYVNDQAKSKGKINKGAVHVRNPSTDKNVKDDLARSSICVFYDRQWNEIENELKEPDTADNET